MRGQRFFGDGGLPGSALSELFLTKYEDVLSANRLAAFVYFTCQGNLFMLAGEEFGRSKLGDSNSYRSRPEINMLRWKQTVEFADLISYYRGLIRLRKRLPGLYDKSPGAAERIGRETIHGSGVVSFTVDNAPLPGRQEECPWPELFIVYNAGDTVALVNVPEGQWTVLADGEEADCRKKAFLRDGNLPVEAKSGMMLGRKVLQEDIAV